MIELPLSKAIPASLAKIAIGTWYDTVLIDIQSIVAKHTRTRSYPKLSNALEGNSRSTDKRGPMPGGVMSKDARRRIGVVMKRRWAEQKKAPKKGTVEIGSTCSTQRNGAHELRRNFCA
jgi:hypothetical protein